MKRRLEVWGDFEEKRAELRVQRVAVEKLVPGLWAREGAGFQCGNEEAGAGIPKEEPRASPWVEVGALGASAGRDEGWAQMERECVEVGGLGASAAGRDEGWAQMEREKAQEGCRGEEVGLRSGNRAGATRERWETKQGLHRGQRCDTGSRVPGADGGKGRGWGLGHGRDGA